MSCGTRELGRLPVATVLLVLCAAAWTTAPAADPAPTGADDNLTTPSAGATRTPDPSDDAKKDKARRDLARRVAALAIVLTLVLILFVVIVMITSRRMRARYLGWHRKIRFNRLWDVWWSKEEPKQKD